jgi:hypothetical protein
VARLLVSSRAELELEVVALRPQLAVLRRRRPRWLPEPSSGVSKLWMCGRSDDGVELLTWLVVVLHSLLKATVGLEAENLLLRQQVIILSREPSARLRLFDRDRLL